ncbi:acyl-CoA dehydrogenase family protein [Chloroflexota bacterium]
MDFSRLPEEEAFQEEVRNWLAVNMKELPEWWTNPEILGPEVGSKERCQFDIWWHRKLYDAGFVGITWPKEYGGRGGTFMQTVICNEELVKHRAPLPVNYFALSFCGPTIMNFGTQQQKELFLRNMLTAGELWCEGFSEPEAGSDLASLQTHAVEDGDDYVVNGQKVWTSEGHFADWAILLARTDTEAPKHRGISYFLLDMHSPGVTLRPLKQITGEADFNEMFLDNVRIPKSMMVGEKNKGWYVAMSTLDYERTGWRTILQNINLLEDLINLARKIEKNGESVTKDPLVRQQLAQLYIEANVAKYNELRSLTRQIRGERPGPEDMVSVLLGVESGQRLTDFAMQLLGPYGQLSPGSKYAIEQGRWQYNCLAWRCRTIAGGTSEIRRNVIAQRALGLPR